MNELLIWLYGRSARNAHIREMAKKAIQILRKQPMEYTELCRALGIGFDKYSKPRRTFYFVVNPLKKVKLIREKRQIIDHKSRKSKTIYFLSPATFQGYMTRIIDEAAEQMKEQ